MIVAIGGKAEVLEDDVEARERNKLLMRRGRDALQACTAALVMVVGSVQCPNRVAKTN